MAMETQNLEVSPTVGGDKGFAFTKEGGKLIFAMELLRNYAGDTADTVHDKTLTKGKEIPFNIFAVSEFCPSMSGAAIPLASVKASDKLTKVTSSAGPTSNSIGHLIVTVLTTVGLISLVGLTF